MKTVNINTICKHVMALDDAYLGSLRNMAQGQLDYVHPLKLATQKKQHKLGEYNMRVVSLVGELREVLKNPPA